MSRQPLPALHIAQALLLAATIMRNLIYALTAGSVAFAVLYFPGILKMAESVVPGLLVMAVAYFLLARRSFKKVEGIFMASAKAMQSQPPRLDLAVQTLEGAYDVGKEQFGITAQIDGQIGVIYFLQKEFNKAMPYLQRALSFGHWMAAAMLSVAYYKKKQHDQMKEALKVVTKKGKKEALPWSLRAYLLCQVGERDEAQKILVEGLKATNNDSRVQDTLTAVQNGKKIKMRAYKDQWYQFHLERPPAQYMQQQIPMRVGKAARRGKWS